jgi:hypothetical protein
MALHFWDITPRRPLRAAHRIATPRQQERVRARRPGATYTLQISSDGEKPLLRMFSELSSPADLNITPT